MFNFNFSEKSLGLVSPPHFNYGFSRKMFLILHMFMLQKESSRGVPQNSCFEKFCEILRKTPAVETFLR